MNKIPIYCQQSFQLGQTCSVFFENQLMNCRILDKKYEDTIYQCYLVEVLEYPAKKRII